ncbi:MAG: DUF2141 domain-containing protein [Sandaracinaceae bacterium]|nr:DUF2141 domain-containing protein [Sandaracinaceae bacterium]
MRLGGSSSSRRVPALLGGLAAALLLASGAVGAQAPDEGEAPAAADEPPAHRLIATIHTRDNRGRVFCALWRGREGYPTERARSVSEAMDRTIVNRRAVCVFDDVTPGEYAMAVFHDENANNDLDRNIFGIPSEGTGASNDAHNMFGPPGYDDARFQLPDVPVHRIVAHIHY